MKINQYVVGILLFSFLFIPNQLCSQVDTTKRWSVELKDDNTFIVEIVEQRDDTLFVRNPTLGLFKIPMEQVKNLEEIAKGKLVKGEYWFDNPHATRYFFAPAGYGLQAGEGYYQNTWLLLNQVSVGLSDNVSIGFGLMPLFLFGGAPTPIWVTPKVSFSSEENFHIGGGAFLGTIIGGGTGGFGIACGTTTIGTRDKNLSVGLGYGFASGDWAKAPTINLSAMTRVGRKGYLLTENYLIGTADGFIGVISLGGRSVGKKITLDYGGVIPLSGEIFIAIPWLGISVPLGNKNN